MAKACDLAFCHFHRFRIRRFRNPFLLGPKSSLLVAFYSRNFTFLKFYFEQNLNIFVRTLFNRKNSFENKLSEKFNSKYYVALCHRNAAIWLAEKNKRGVLSLVESLTHVTLLLSIIRDWLSFNLRTLLLRDSDNTFSKNIPQKIFIRNITLTDFTVNLSGREILTWKSQAMTLNPSKIQINLLESVSLISLVSRSSFLRQKYISKNLSQKIFREVFTF